MDSQLFHPCTKDPAHVSRTEAGGGWLRTLDFGMLTSPGIWEMGWPTYRKETSRL